MCVCGGGNSKTPPTHTNPHTPCHTHPPTHTPRDLRHFARPQGWMSWEIFRCDVHCDVDPAACINHALYEQQTDRIVADGYLAAGYDQVSIDGELASATAAPHVCGHAAPLLSGAQSSHSALRAVRGP